MHIAHGVCDCDSMKRNTLYILYCIVLDQDQSERIICSELFDCDERAPPTHALTAQTNASRTETICCHPFEGCFCPHKVNRICSECVCSSVYAVAIAWRCEPICARRTDARFVYISFVWYGDCESGGTWCTSFASTMDCAIFKTWQIRAFPDFAGCIVCF